MAKPVILTIDDEPEVLNSIERDLRQHYSELYRVMKASSGELALETTKQLKKRGTAVALFVVDQRMPGMTGTQFLAEALKLYPDARRVLLTAYADTDTAITAINDIDLDHYLLKPWEPPSERLYPVLDDLLSDWFARARPEYDGIRVAGTVLSPGSYVIRDFLAGHQIPYQWLDIDNDAAARELVARVSPGAPRLPIVFLPGGESLVQPETRELADRVGMQMRAQLPFYDLVIVGGGPGRACRRRLCRIRGAPDRSRRTRRAGWSGQDQLADRKLPRLSGRHQRRRSGTPRIHAGTAFRDGDPVPPGGGRHLQKGPIPNSPAGRRQ